MRRRLASNTAQVKARQEHRQRIGTVHYGRRDGGFNAQRFHPVALVDFPDVGNNGPSMVIGVGFY